MTRPDRRNVKSASPAPIDGHERRRDLLGEPEIARLLESARQYRNRARDHLLLLMVYRQGLPRWHDR
jgi:hypothetical protein